ncbi:MAG: methyltransferase domain-containing protein [Cyclobacteriaceae bacterium]|jgi:2-polyprenyl-3-methyl-5-hydroxy-6-metoxy-1,4-benzoquinol methylase|nr:methyltransferase domain-containing protein [Cyclobacteriaceae bacterium]
MAIDFSTRSEAEELMDDLACQGEVVNQTLRELDFINQWLGGNQITISAVKEIWKRLPKDQTITIADLGCGSGEILRIMAQLAIKENRNVQLIGFDANPKIIEYARMHSNEFPNISFEAQNVFSCDFQKRKFDIVTATLFMHHFSKADLVNLLSSLIKQTSKAIIINDIHRHHFAYYSIKWLTQLFSRSEMVKFDAPLSVLRAFTKQEWKDIMGCLHEKRYTLSWKWAFRWKLIVKLSPV